MDFGDILDKWDQEKTKPAAKKAVETTGTEKAGREAPQVDSQAALAASTTPSMQNKAAGLDPVTAWIRVNGIVDKDADGEESAVSSSERRRRRLAKKSDASLDLHGLGRDEAWVALEDFFRAGSQQGFDKLLIVHGKGNHSNGDAVLKRTVRDFIEHCPCAGESGRGTAVEGGNGATWVLLKDGQVYQR
jgi:DNA-nicking Smr family endonuclease